MLVHPQFDPVAIQLGPLAIHWYGITYLVAFGLFIFLANRRLKQAQYTGLVQSARFNTQSVEDLLFYGAVGVVLGGRIDAGCDLGDGVICKTKKITLVVAHRLYRPLCANGLGRGPGG